MLYAIVALLIVILDQWTKYWVAANIVENSGVKEVIPGILSLINLHNDGAAFGFLSGANATLIFAGICVVFCIAVIILLATRVVRGSLGRWALIFIMAGGIGNCIDRVVYAYVQDMFKIDAINWFPIFNVADAFIVFGCVLFILYILFGGNKRARRREEEDEYYDDDEYEDDDYDEDEDEDDYEDRKPAKKKRLSLRERRRMKKEAEYDDEYERRRGRRLRGRKAREAFQA